MVCEDAASSRSARPFFFKREELCEKGRWNVRRGWVLIASFWERGIVLRLESVSYCQLSLFWSAYLNWHSVRAVVFDIICLSTFARTGSGGGIVM